MASLFKKLDENWREGYCDVCGLVRPVMKVETQRALLPLGSTVEMRISMCQECAIQTAGALLALWGYTPKDE